MVKRKFMTDAQWDYHQESYRQYQIMQNARKSERQALLIKALNMPKPSRFSVIRSKCRTMIRKRENEHATKRSRWNRSRGVC